MVHHLTEQSQLRILALKKALELMKEFSLSEYFAVCLMNYTICRQTAKEYLLALQGIGFLEWDKTSDRIKVLEVTRNGTN